MKRIDYSYLHKRTSKIIYSKQISILPSCQVPKSEKMKVSWMPIHLSPLIKCVLSLSLGLHSHWSLLFPGAHHLSPCVSLTQFQCILRTVAILISPPQSWSCHSLAFQALVGSPSPPCSMVFNDFSYSDQFPLLPLLHPHFRVDLPPSWPFHKSHPSMS